METETAVGPDAYDELLDRYERYTSVQSAGGVLSWDQQVTMPEGGTPARTKQQSVLSSMGHELITDDRIGELLTELTERELADERAAVVREIRRTHERAASVPQDLVEDISETASEALTAWEEAKRADDFDQFAPYLETHVELKREYAAEIDPDRDPYAVLMEEYEPCLSLHRVESILESVRERLVPLIEEIRQSDTTLAVDSFDGEFPVDDQEQLARETLDILGFDWDRGRLDTSTHPFTSGNQFDTRITTRFDETDPLGALGSTIHEFGHAQYCLGLPQAEWGTPLGESRDLSVHESQSRLWENHVGRSRSFWEMFLPKMKEQFPGVEDVSVTDAYQAANQVYEDNLIRVEADELTYHLHVLVRFEIERDLVNGKLEAENVPKVWNDKCEQYLGIRPETDAKGCLQDIHWSHGNFGYFPTYTLGSVMAAQLYAAADRDIENLSSRLTDGDFNPLHEWLSTNVHQYGARFETNDLVKEATGEEFTADRFLEYVENKYSKLYDL